MAQTERRGGDVERGDARHRHCSTIAAGGSGPKSSTCTPRWRSWRRSIPRLARVVEMRYFGGMEDAEIAEVLGLSDAHGDAATGTRRGCCSRTRFATAVNRQRADAGAMRPLAAFDAKWAAISALLDEALGLPASEHAAWLDGLVGEHAAHREALAGAARASGRKSRPTTSCRVLPRLRQRAASASPADSPHRATGSAPTGCSTRSGRAAWARCGSPNAPTAR